MDFLPLPSVKPVNSGTRARNPLVFPFRVMQSVFISHNAAIETHTWQVLQRFRHNHLFSNTMRSLAYPMQIALWPRKFVTYLQPASAMTGGVVECWLPFFWTRSQRETPQLARSCPTKRHHQGHTERGKQRERSMYFIVGRRHRSVLSKKRQDLERLLTT